MPFNGFSLAIMNPEQKRQPTPFETVILPSDPALARSLQTTIESQLEKRSRASERDIFCVCLALEEALVNAIKHGNQMDPAKQLVVAYRVESESIEIKIQDEGNGFDPGDVPDPTAAENLERPCGRGLLLMRHYMNEVEYNARGNVVHMKKLFTPS